MEEATSAEGRGLPKDPMREGVHGLQREDAPSVSADFWRASNMTHESSHNMDGIRRPSSQSSTR